MKKMICIFSLVFSMYYDKYDYFSKKKRILNLKLVKKTGHNVKLFYQNKLTSPGCF